MADKGGYYRDTRTGAIRQSANVLGYPFVEATKAEIEALPGRKASKPASSGKASSEDAGKAEG